MDAGMRSMRSSFSACGMAALLSTGGWRTTYRGCGSWARFPDRAGKEAEHPTRTDADPHDPSFADRPREAAAVWAFIPDQEADDPQRESRWSGRAGPGGRRPPVAARSGEAARCRRCPVLGLPLQQSAVADRETWWRSTRWPGG